MECDFHYPSIRPTSLTWDFTYESQDYQDYRDIVSRSNDVVVKKILREKDSRKI